MPHPHPYRGLLLIGQAAFLALALCTAMWAAEPQAIGAGANAGCLADPERVQRLSIKKPGVYENLLIDGEWSDSTLVKITADDVTLRHCEIRHGTHNAITVTGKNVVIESCKIHHLLKGTYDDQQDAHGITGSPTNLVVRNCDIGLVSGDALQFDPGRGKWDDVLIDRCTLWTAPLESDAAGFKRGQRPGENGIDTKQRTSNLRSKITVRNTLFHGWNQPSQISNMAALNLKNHVEARIQNCVLRDNEIAFRLRGGEGEYGGAVVAIENCAVYDSQVAVRAESGIRDLKIRRLGIGDGVKRKLAPVDGGPGEGYENNDEFAPPPFDEAVKTGLKRS